MKRAVGHPHGSSTEWFAFPPTATAATTRPSPRWRALLEAVLCSLVGAALYMKVSRSAALMTWGIGAFTLLLAVVSPQHAYAWLQQRVRDVASLIGHIAWWVVLPTVFFLIMMPFGALFRRGRRDPLKRQFDRQARSYFTPPRPTSSPKNLF